ncbi:pyridoxamine 5'-phosphate oxidase family protein [Actinomycetospora sp. C-140]
MAHRGLVDTGFHEGELRVQQRAGVADDADRLAGMLTTPHLGEGMSRFVAERELAFITAEDDHGRLWTSPVFGPRGFASGNGQTLTLASAVPEGDPLAGLPAGRQVGVLLIDFARRRRLRVNGVLSSVRSGALTVAVEQAYGNCPRYIHPLDDTALAGAHPAGRGDGLRSEDLAQIAAADTFILGTRHPDRGADTSHRGGDPGFVHHADGRLWWPDHPGNNLFNTLGNLEVDPSASLLFLDPGRGAILQLSGTAVVEWTDDEETGRRVWFTPERVANSAVGDA